MQVKTKQNEANQIKTKQHSCVRSPYVLRRINKKKPEKKRKKTTEIV